MDEQAFTLLMSKLNDHDDRFDKLENLASERFADLKEGQNEILRWKYKVSGIVVVITAVMGFVGQIFIAKVNK